MVELRGRGGRSGRDGLHRRDLRPLVQARDGLTWWNKETHTNKTKEEVAKKHMQSRVLIFAVTKVRSDPSSQFSQRIWETATMKSRRRHSAHLDTDPWPRPSTAKAGWTILLANLSILVPALMSRIWSATSLRADYPMAELISRAVDSSSLVITLPQPAIRI